MSDEPWLARSRSVMLGSWLLDVLTRTIWISRQDLTLIGGDPISIALRLAREARNTGPRKRRRVALITSGGFNGAPIAALADPEFRSSVRRLLGPKGLPLGRVPTQDNLPGSESPRISLRAPVNPPSLDSDRLSEVRQSIIALMDEAAALISASGLVLLHCADMVDADYDPIRRETLLRVGRPMGVMRPRALTEPAGLGQCSRDGAVPILPSGQDSYGEKLLMQSAALSQIGFRLLDRRILSMGARLPAGKRFADIIATGSIEILSGHVGPARSRPPVEAARKHRVDRLSSRPLSTPALGASFAEGELGAEIYNLGRGHPLSVGAAIEAWAGDLHRAATGTMTPTASS